MCTCLAIARVVMNAEIHFGMMRGMKIKAAKKELMRTYVHICQDCSFCVEDCGCSKT